MIRPPSISTRSDTTFPYTSLCRSDMKVPHLGPPMAGELVPPMRRAEQESAAEYGLGPNPEDDAARAERLRLARKAQQAREAGVFFQVSARPAAGKEGRRPDVALADTDASQIGRAHV